MTDLDVLCAELVCGEDARAEIAAIRLPEYGQAALEVLHALLKDPQAENRWWAVRALAGFEINNETTEALVAALEDESVEVRQAAAMAFCHHPDPQALPALAQALADQDSMTARLASNALSLLGSQACPALLDVLKNGKQSARLEAVRALAEIKDPRSIPALMHELETDSALVQYWATLGLDKMGVGMLYLKPD